MPKKNCTACGEPMESHWETCPLCGAKQPQASGIQLDDDQPAPTPPSRVAPPEPEAPPAEEAPAAKPQASPPDMPEPPPASEPTSSEPGGEEEEPAEGTLRMSLSDATKAWVEDTTASRPKEETPAPAASAGSHKTLLIALVAAIVAIGVVLAFFL